MDITGPYKTTQRKTRFLLTFTDNFSKYVEAFPIPDMTAQTVARVYATQSRDMAQDQNWLPTKAEILCPHFLRKPVRY